MTTKIINVPFESLIVDDDFNARKDFDDIDQLATSIRANGLLEPIGVVAVKSGDGTQYKIIYGSRRYRALVSIREDEPAAFATLDVVLSNNVTTSELQLANLAENVERNSLKPWEIAGRIKELVNIGLEQRDIAARLGRPQSWVSYFYKLSTKLNPVAWKAFTEDKLTIEQALNVADIPDESQTEIIEKIVNADTRAEARQIAKDASRTNGNRRTYSNKGRPTFKHLASFVEDVSFEGTSDVYDTEEKSFFNGLAAGLRVALGTLDFKDVAPDDSYLDVDYSNSLKKLKTAAEENEAVDPAEETEATVEEVAPTKTKKKSKAKGTKTGNATAAI